MCRLLKQQYIAVFTSVFLVPLALAVQPLSEDDMDGVSAETGQNILDIFGPTAAGLEEDDDSASSETEETKETKAIAARILEDAEDQNSQQDSATQPQLSFEEIENALEAGISVTGSAQVFDTSSEIQYREQDFHHEARFLADGTVIHERDLYIDVLKLENLRGDDSGGGDSLGSIYLHDWKSQGSTRMTVDD